MIDQHTQLITAVVGRAAQYVGLTSDAILTTGRMPRAVHARHLATAILVHHGVSVSEIARFVGRDHASLLHGLRKMEQAPASVAAFNNTLPHPLHFYSHTSAIDALAELLRHSADLTLQERAVITTYVRVDLLNERGAWRLMQPLAAYYGRQAVHSRPHLQHAIRDILTHYKH